MRKLLFLLSLALWLGISNITLFAQGGIDYSKLCKGEGIARDATPGRIVKDLAVTTTSKLGSKTQSIRIAGNILSSGFLFFDNVDLATLTVRKGDVVSIKPSIYDLDWMHFYLYIDYNHDGQFDTDKELVSYTHYRDGEVGDFINSRGIRFREGSLRNGGELPGFEIPKDVKLGKTRARFKSDWNSKDPCGSADIGKFRGLICDFTVDIQDEAPELKSYNVNLKVEGGNGTASLFEKTMKVPVVAGVAKENMELELTLQPNEGYEASQVLHNGVDKKKDVVDNKYSFIVKDHVNLVVRFAKKSNSLAVEDIDSDHASYSLNVGKGYLTISNIEAGTPVELYTLSGTKLHQSLTDGNTLRLTAESGIYILKVGEASIKIAIK